MKLKVYLRNWASLMAQIVKNLPAMQEPQVQSLGWEDPLEKVIVKWSHSVVSDSLRPHGL